MQTNPPILSSTPDKLKSDCINQLDQLLTVVKSSELTAVDLLPKRASAARERRASAARSRAAAVARVKRAAAARQQAAARATARKKYYAQQAAAAARKASIAKAKAAAVVVANRAAAARRQAVAVAAAAAATAAANKRRKEQEDANKKLAIQAAIKQAEKAEFGKSGNIARPSGAGVYDSKGPHAYSATKAHSELLTPSAKAAFAQARKDAAVGAPHEEGGWIYADGTIGRWPANPDKPNGITTSIPTKGKTVVGSFHTHPQDHISDGKEAKYYQDPSKVVTKNGAKGDLVNQLDPTKTTYNVPSVILGADGINRYY